MYQQKYGENSLLFILNIHTGQIQDRWRIRDNYHDVVLTPDNLLICSSRPKRAVDVYNLTDRRLLKTFKTGFPVYRAKLTHDKSHLMCSGANESVHIFDFNKGNLITKLKTNSKQIHDFAFTADKKYLAVCEYTSNSSPQGSLLYFELVSGKCVSHFKCGKSLTKMYIDEAQHTMLTIDNNGINLINYEFAIIPRLDKLCADIIQAKANLSFFKGHFESPDLTHKQKNTLGQYFQFEDEAENIVLHN